MAISTNLTIRIDEMDMHLGMSHEANLVPIFKSKPGIGKTSIVKARKRALQAQYPDKKVGLFFVDGANANVNDLIGYLMPKDTKYETESGTIIEMTEGRYTFPHFLFEVDEGKPIFLYDIIIICIDEYGQMGGEEKRACSTMLQERRIGLYHLPAAARIVLLTNRSHDKAGVSKDFSHMANRMQHFNVVTHVEAIVNFGVANKWEPMLLAFAHRNVDIVCNDDVQEKDEPQEIGPICTPRSLDFLNADLKVCKARGWALDDPRVAVRASGTVGLGAAKQFTAMVGVLHLLPKFSEVERTPLSATLPDNPSARYLIAFELAARTTHKNIDAVITYMRRMPASYAVCYLSAVLKDRTFLSHKCVGDWLQDNYELMAAVGDIK